MEFIAERPVTLSVHSADTRLISTNYLINVHPKTKIARILQYVHYQITIRLNSGQLLGQAGDKDRETVTLDTVSNYHLEHDDRVLPLEGDIEEVIPTDQLGKVVHLRFVENFSSSGRSPLNLDYDPETEFNTINVRIMLNTLSQDKIYKTMDHNLPLDASLMKLKKVALKHLVAREMALGAESYCELREKHQTDDFLSFKFEGQADIVELNAKNREIYVDTSLAQFLNLTLTPTKDAIFTVLFYVRHRQYVDPQDNTFFRVDLTSNAELFQQYVYINKDTTVHGVRKFICILSSISEHTEPKDIKLIYNGQLVHDKNFAGNDARLSSYFQVKRNVTLLVHISPINFGLLDPFWSQSIAMERRNAEALRATRDAATKSEKQTSDTITVEGNTGPREETPSSLSKQDTVEKQKSSGPRFVTESGSIIEPLRGTYIKCLLDGVQEVFIESSALDPMERVLVATDPNGILIEIPLSGNDYHIIGENALGVKEDVISTLERQLGYTLEHDTVTSLKHGQISHRPTRNDDNINIRLLGPQLWHLLRKTLKFLRITLLTFYYLGRSSLFFGLLIFEITAFVSIWYVIPLVGFLLLRTIMTSEEIKAMWTEYLGVYWVDDEKYDVIKRYVSEHEKPVDDDFIDECQSNPRIFSLLLNDTLRTTRLNLYQKNGINQMGNMTDNDCLKELLRQIKSDQINQQPLVELLQSLFYAEESGHLNSEEEVALDRLLSNVAGVMDKSNVSALPLPQRILILLRNRVSNIPTEFMERVVPDPRHDNLVSGILKNLVLFFLLFFPMVKESADTIIQRRAAECARAEREATADRPTQEVSTDEPSPTTTTPTTTQNVAPETTTDEIAAEGPADDEADSGVSDFEVTEEEIIESFIGSSNSSLDEASPETDRFSGGNLLHSPGSRNSYGVTTGAQLHNENP